MTKDQAAALELLSSISKEQRFKMAKISAKENRPYTVSMNYLVTGTVSVVNVGKTYPGWVENHGYKADDFCVLVCERLHDYIRTSPVQRVGKTEEGIILIETENSIYRLEPVA